MTDKIQIMELFGPTIQGEGLMTGTVTHFLRTGGCPLRCEWCDSLFAVLPEEIKKHRRMMDVGQIFKALTALPWAPYVTFTGGDPCIQERLGDIVIRLNIEANMLVAVETQGMFFPDWLEKVDVITFSPKGPSSGNVVDIEDMQNWLRENYKRARVCIKIVCFTDEDFQYALGVYDAIPEQYYDAFYFTAGTPLLEKPKQALSEEDKDAVATARTVMVMENQHALAELILKGAHELRFNHKVHIGCQQHVLLWPTEDKGV